MSFPSSFSYLALALDRIGFEHVYVAGRAGRGASYGVSGESAERDKRMIGDVRAITLSSILEQHDCVASSISTSQAPRARSSSRLPRCSATEFDGYTSALTVRTSSDASVSSSGCWSGRI